MRDIRVGLSTVRAELEKREWEDPQQYVACVSLDGLDAAARDAGPPACRDSVSATGEEARSKKLARHNAARAGLREWTAWPGWGEQWDACQTTGQK